MKGQGRSKQNISRVKMEIDSDSSQSVPNMTFSASSSGDILAEFLRKDVADIDSADITSLQFEMEQILLTSVRKKGALLSAVSVLENIQTNKKKRSRSTESAEKKLVEERQPKKSKDNNTKSHSSSTVALRSKNIQAPSNDSHLELPKIPKNDGPNRFWIYMDSYCADLTQDTIRMIESWLNPDNESDHYLKIPELGEHYAAKWTLDDMKEEIREGSKSVENPTGLFSNSTEDCAEASRLLNMAKDLNSSLHDEQYASMSDRIVYSLVSENLMTPLDEMMSESCSDTNISNQKAEAVSVPIAESTQCDNLEERLRKELIKIDLLDPEDSEKEPTDEISLELKRIQSALIPVQEYNQIQKKKLLALARAEISKQEVKKKLQELDAKVMDLYRTVASARKNKTMNKKLEDQVKRLLRERRRIIEKLNSMT